MNDAGTGDDDWRLVAKSMVAESARSLGELVHGLHAVPATGDTGAVPADVVLTCNDDSVFAYASDPQKLRAARIVLEQAFRTLGATPLISVSHWDDAVSDWVQVDPRVRRSETARRPAARARDPGGAETRTLVVCVGKVIRAEFEQVVRASAEALGVECDIVEHPHLLTTQVGLTVSGPKTKLDDFVKDLRDEERMTIRADRGVMFGPG